MQLPFVSRSRYMEMLCLKNQQIAQLEGERRLLWDKICLLGIGAPVFTSLTGDDPKQPDEPQGKQGGNATPTPMRPSAIMRRMDRLAEARWLRKIKSSATSKDEANRR